MQNIWEVQNLQKMKNKIKQIYQNGYLKKLQKIKVKNKNPKPLKQVARNNIKLHD